VRAVVVALGKIGLPLAAQIALAGHEVVGVDIDPRVVEAVNAAQAPFPGEEGLAEALREVVGAGRLRAVADATRAVAAGAELVVAVPPLVVDEQARPDFRVLDAVVDAIGDGLRPGTVVSVETTLPVGTTRGRVARALAARSGLEPEEEFWTVHSPERVFSGRVFADLATYPKLVGGLSAAGEQRAVALYAAFLAAEVRGMGSAEAAELTKLAETTYRDVNIALANELARYADAIGVDVARVIEAANSQPFSHLHHPGVAVGGHCIPVYPRFLVAGDPDARLPLVAREINDGMPGYAVRRLEAALGDDLAGRRVLILGVAYRGAVKETAFSGAYALRDALAAHGAEALAGDPLYDTDELQQLGFAPWTGGAVDAAIVQADHPAYADLAPDDVPGARVVLDGRGIVRPAPLQAAGIDVVRLGDGSPRLAVADPSLRGA